MGVLLGLASVWVSSRDDVQATRESGSELGVLHLPSASPDLGIAPASPTPRPSKRVVRRAKPGVPQRLTISSIGVSAPIEAVGVLPDNSQEVPDDPDTVGWYRAGSKPGQPGNAVITGHTWSAGDGVFDRLPRLKPGSLIALTTSAGDRSYRVGSVGSIDLADFGAQAPDIYRTTGTSGLVLMTCGDWNGSSYEATTVVYAELLR